jgi:hypothetical protein
MWARPESTNDSWARLITPMFGLFPQSPHMPCTECGASVERAAADAHVCDTERMLDFRLFQLRDEIAAFDAQFAAWLASARGRFATWLAERDPRRPTSS